MNISGDPKRLEHEDSLLAEVGSVLASTLDSRGTLTAIAQLTMRRLADFCVIEFIDELDGVVRLAAVASDPRRQVIAEQLLTLPLHRSRPNLSQSLLESPKPLFLAELPAGALTAYAESPEQLALLEAMGPTSLMGVPLAAQGRLLGALVVGSCQPEHRYDARDLWLLTEVARRAAFTLESARLYRVATSAIQQRDKVLGVIAHDLRTPLGTLLMQASLMRRGGGETERRSDKPVRAIERAVGRMSRLVEDLLDVARIEAGHLSIKAAQVEARQVIADAVEAQRQLTADSAIDLKVDLPASLPDIWADRERLLQVFDNLIGNAAKFTASGGSITVGARPHDGELLFWVEDTGMGISDSELPHLFDRFWQANKTERRGAGLGLPIVKGIVEAHGGRIWVESAPGRGSTFFSTVPFAPSLLLSARPELPCAAASLHG